MAISLGIYPTFSDKPRCIQYLHAVGYNLVALVLSIDCLDMFGHVWTLHSLFFLCQSSCATLCVHIHHQKKKLVFLFKKKTSHVHHKSPVVGDVTIHFRSRSWPHHHCCEKDPWQPGNLVDALMAPVRICQSLIHQASSCSPSYKLYTQVSQSPYGCVWKCCVPLNPMVLLIIIPFLNGYFIGNIPNIFRQAHICPT